MDLTYFILFNILVVILLIIDLKSTGKNSNITTKKALIWSGIWIGVALLFNFFIYYTNDRHEEATFEFLVAYLVEKSLSVDNLFVFLMIFSAFKLPMIMQHRVLFYGIVGAVILRIIFIYTGVELLQKFHWLIYVFGGFLIFTGFKLFKDKDEEMDIQKNLSLRLAKKIFRITDDYDGEKFFTKRNGLLYATPLFLVLILIESTDVIFALDSIPAVLAISDDFFIVYTSNIFAILGLRSLYFALAGIMPYFKYLHYGLAVILIFIGTKMVIMEWYHIPVFISLIVVGGVLTISVLASMILRESEVAESNSRKS